MGSFLVLRRVFGVMAAMSSIVATSAIADVTGYPPSRYYVATTGSDTAAGTSAQPFKTIQKAVDVAVAVGVEVIVAVDVDVAVCVGVAV